MEQDYKSCNRKYLAAAINCDAVLADKEQNLKEQCALVEEAAKKGAKLIALPEMSTTGYCWYSHLWKQFLVQRPIALPQLPQRTNAGSWSVCLKWMREPAFIIMPLC